MTQTCFQLPGRDVSPAALPSHGSPGRVEMIDAVRGLACLWVLMHHSYLYWVWRIHLPFLWHLNQAAQLGFLGVHLFLVISGFVLFFPVVRKFGIRGAKVDSAKFFKRRAWRILPPYYLALILFAALTLLPIYRQRGSILNWQNDLLHLTMLYNLSSRTITMFNGAFWSLALEFQLYLAFPLLLWGCRKFGLLPTIGGALIVSVLWQSLIVPMIIFPNGHHISDQDWNTHAVWYNAVPGRWFEFAMGMTAAALVVQPRRGQNIVALILILLLTPVATYLELERGYFGPARDQLWGIVFAGVLLLVSSTPPKLAESSIARVTAWAGGISYSIYLMHEPLLQMSQLLLDRWHVPLVIRLPLFIVTGLPLLVAIGFGFHLLAERPFMSAKRPPLSPDALSVVPVAVNMPAV